MASRLAASKEAVSEGDVTPTVTFYDAVQNQIPSSKDISYALDSYLQSRDLQARGGHEGEPGGAMAPPMSDLGEPNGFGSPNNF